MIDTEALRKKVIDLAIQGKLTEQLPSDGDAETLYAQIQEEKARLIKEGKIKKEKPLPPIADDEIPFEIPDNWMWMRLGDIARIYGGKRIPAGRSLTTDDTGHKYIRVSDMKNRSVITDGLLFVPEDIFPSISRYIINKEDVYITVAGTIGKVGKIPDEIDGVNLTENADRIVFEYLNQDWMIWCLSASLIQKQIEQLTTQVAQPKLAIKRIQEFSLPVPPLDEQERIATIINKVFECIDIIDDLQEKYRYDLATLKAKIIDAGIRGKLTEQLPEDGDAETLYAQIQEEKAKLIKEGKIKKEKLLPDISANEIPFEISKNWKWVRLGDISAKISSGNTPSGGKKANVYVEEGYCFFREQNIYDDGIHEEGLVYITEELLNSRPNSTVLPKDILLNITGGSIGRCAMVPDDFSRGSINQHILIIRMIDYEIRTYVHKVLCSPYGQKHIKGNAVGDKDGFSGGRCKNMLIPLPPKNELFRIVKCIDETLKALDEV